LGEFTETGVIGPEALLYVAGVCISVTHTLQYRSNLPDFAAGGASTEPVRQ